MNEVNKKDKSNLDKNIQVSIYRFNAEVDEKPYMQDFSVPLGEAEDMMVLDVILYIKDNLDSTLSVRRSCREGVCGSDAVNINGKNRLACVTPVSELRQPIIIRPLPGLPIVRDLIVDMTDFYNQYNKVKPYLRNKGNPPTKERLQSPEEASKLEGLYECILCACCTTSCPSFWWNPDKFAGPAALLQSYRFIADSRDDYKAERLEDLKDSFSVFRCRTIMNCVDACPKGLNPTQAINNIRTEMLVSDSNKEN